MEYKSKDVMALIVKFVGKSLYYQELLSYFVATQGPFFFWKVSEEVLISPYEICLDLKVLRIYMNLNSVFALSIDLFAKCFEIKGVVQHFALPQARSTSYFNAKSVIILHMVLESTSVADKVFQLHEIPYFLFHSKNSYKIHN